MGTPVPAPLIPFRHRTDRTVSMNSMRVIVEGVQQKGTFRACPSMEHKDRALLPA